MKRISKHGFDSVSVPIHIMRIEKVIFKVPFLLILLFYIMFLVFLHLPGFRGKKPEQILHVHLLTYVPSIIVFTLLAMVEWCGVELSHHWSFGESHHWSFGECLGLCIILIFCGDMFEIRDSIIHGKGLFTTSAWYPGVALPHTRPHDVDANPFFYE